MGFIDIRIGSRGTLPAATQRAEDTAYFCTDGGLYVGEYLIAERNAYQLPIVTYRAVSLSGIDKLIVAQLNSQGSVDLTQIADGTLVVVINPDGVYASGITRIEDASNADNINFPTDVSVYMDGKATGFTAVAYNGVLYPLPAS